MINSSGSIAVLDSGIGGLTAFKVLRALLPGEDLIYLGDTGRIPYGTRSRDTIARYTRGNLRFLAQFKVKALLVACNTISATVLPEVCAGLPFPVQGLVDETAGRAAQITRNNRIGVIATPATIRSGAYEYALAGVAPDARVCAQPCSLLVPIVENGRFRPGDVVTETLVAEYLAPVKDFGADTLVMGCTHYPLLRPIIAQYMGEGVALVDSGAVGAETFAARLGDEGLLNGNREGGSEVFYVSDSTESFRSLASLFLERELAAERVVQVEIE